MKNKKHVWVAGAIDNMFILYNNEEGRYIIFS